MTASPKLRLVRMFHFLGCALLCSCQSETAMRFAQKVSPPRQEAFQAIAAKSPIQRAASTSDAAIEMTPELTERGEAQVQLAMARMLENSGDFNTATAAYEAVIRNDKSNATAFHRLALLKEKTAQGEESKDLLLKASKLDPNNAEIACDLGYWYYLRRDWKNAQLQFQRAISLNPSLRRAHNNMGLTLARAGMPDQATEFFRAAGLTEAEARTNLGIVFATEHRLADARLELSRAVAVNPELMNASRAMTDLQQLERRTIAEPTSGMQQSERFVSAKFEPQTTASLRQEEQQVSAEVEPQPTVSPRHEEQFVSANLAPDAPLVPEVPHERDVTEEPSLKIVEQRDEPSNRWRQEEQFVAARLEQEAVQRPAPAIVQQSYSSIIGNAEKLNSSSFKTTWEGGRTQIAARPTQIEPDPGSFETASSNDVDQLDSLPESLPAILPRPSFIAPGSISELKVLPPTHGAVAAESAASYANDLPRPVDAAEAPQQASSMGVAVFVAPAQSDPGRKRKLSETFDR